MGKLFESMKMPLFPSLDSTNDDDYDELMDITPVKCYNE